MSRAILQTASHASSAASIPATSARLGTSGTSRSRFASWTPVKSITASSVMLTISGAKNVAMDSGSTATSALIQHVGSTIAKLATLMGRLIATSASTTSSSKTISAIIYLAATRVVHLASIICNASIGFARSESVPIAKKLVLMGAIDARTVSSTTRERMCVRKIHNAQ